MTVFSDARWTIVWRPGVACMNTGLRGVGPRLRRSGGRAGLLLALLALAAAPAAHAQVVVLDGADLLPVSGDRIPGGRVVMRDGKLAAVGRADAVRIPAGAEVRDHRGHVIVPGLVDTHSHLGLYPRPNVPAHSDGNETSGPVQSGVRALDAIWRR
jgi:hypothetical protein